MWKVYSRILAVYFRNVQKAAKADESTYVLFADAFPPKGEEEMPPVYHGIEK